MKETTIGGRSGRTNALVAEAIAYLMTNPLGSASIVHTEDMANRICDGLRKQGYQGKRKQNYDAQHRMSFTITCTGKRGAK